MKAIIMAGGEGTRLRPVNANRPKPMVNILDRPILEHIILLLKRHGIDEVCLTLRHLPESIKNHFGNGSALGVGIEYRLEDKPLGTAGGVKNCAGFLGTGDFLVISGDCVCDLDLGALAGSHKSRGGLASMALYACREPLEYGSVVTGAGGRIERFVEKPPWERVVTDLVNTGVYVLSSDILSRIPDGIPYDFGKDLFPRLLSEGVPMYGLPMGGYWCDVGNCGAYLRCCIAALAGDIALDIDAPELRHGVFSLSPLPAGAHVIPPVYIGRSVRIESGARVGPCAVIGEGSSVGTGASVRESVLDGAAVHENASVTGAVICRGASIGADASVCEGAVVGENCLIGGGASVLQNVRLWPDRAIPAGAQVKCSVTNGLTRERLAFGADGTISGEVGAVITPEYCASLGAAAAAWKRVGVGWGGGDASRVMAGAMGCGVCAGGGELVEYDGGFRAEAAYVGPAFALPLTAFFEQRGCDVSVCFYSGSGMPISRDMQRRLEALSDLPRACADGVGRVSKVGGVFDSYCAAAARYGRGGLSFHEGISVSAEGRGAENRALRSALSLLGSSVVPRRAGVPVFTAGGGGLTISAEDEDGYAMSWEQLLIAVALIEFECGGGRIAVPFGAPAALDLLAKDFGSSVLRIGRDGAQADELYAGLPYMRDGIFAAARICAYLANRGDTLAALRGRIPKFSSASREVAVPRGRGAAMRELARSCAEFSTELGAGMRIDAGRGWAHVSASPGRAALRVRAECESEEAAEELCADIVRRIELLGKSD